MPIDPSKIKLRQHPNRFQALAAHNIADSDAEKYRVREGSISNASSSRGNKRREPISLTAQILQLLDRLEPDKGRQGKLFTEHLTGHRVLPSTEKELAHILEQRAKKEAER